MAARGAWMVIMMVCGGGAMVLQPHTQGEGNLWAVLVAGSTGWFNYRHQADVCHAYQILHQHGVPDERIIVMMHDDLVHHNMNPTPGKLINRPDGPDVYQGVPKDYTGNDLTPNNFLKVLQGDAKGLSGVGSGKVLGSGPNDRVFINLVSHGSPGLFEFPNTFLHARKFVSTLVDMHKNKQFKEMTVYMESCESGSMFETLPDDITGYGAYHFYASCHEMWRGRGAESVALTAVYAVSASNTTETSSACYWIEKMQTFLGDVFSVKWMEDSDREDVNKETLKAQYTLIKNETTTSHVMQWGQTSLDTLEVGDFVGGANPQRVNYGPFSAYKDPCLQSAVPNPDVPEVIVKHKINTTLGLPENRYWKEQMSQLQQNRSLVQKTMLTITTLLTKGDLELAKELTRDHHHQHINHHHCFEEATDYFYSVCFSVGENPYALRASYVLVNLCEHGYTAQEFITAAKTICKTNHNTGFN